MSARATKLTIYRKEEKHGFNNNTTQVYLNNIINLAHEPTEKRINLSHDEKNNGKRPTRNICGEPTVCYERTNNTNDKYNRNSKRYYHTAYNGHKNNLKIKRHSNYAIERGRLGSRWSIVYTQSLTHICANT